MPNLASFFLRRSSGFTAWTNSLLFACYGRLNSLIGGENSVIC
jgi:hypothetical protein